MKAIGKVLVILALFAFVSIGLYWNFLQNTSSSKAAIVIIAICAVPISMIYSILK